MIILLATQNRSGFLHCLRSTDLPFRQFVYHLIKRKKFTVVRTRSLTFYYIVVSHEAGTPPSSFR